MNVEIGIQNIITLFWKYRGQAVSLLGIHKSDQTFILDSHRPFIGTVVTLQGSSGFTKKTSFMT
jgi:hypothetical protein